MSRAAFAPGGRIAVACWVLLLLFTSLPLRAAGESEPLVITTAAGGRFPFLVEIADTPSKRARGLMFRRRMAPEAGMLFLFGAPEVASFWMKNTPLSLDLFFIGPKGRILDMSERAVPYSTRPINSRMPVVAVLEVLAGTARRLGIRVGDRVEHRAFGDGG